MWSKAQTCASLLLKDIVLQLSPRDCLCGRVTWSLAELLTHLQVSDDDKGKGVGPVMDQSKPEGMRYMQRIVDEIIAVLFDSRRQSCHGLILNRFIAVSGFKQLLVAFQHACHTLFTIVREAETHPAAPIASGGQSVWSCCEWRAACH